jgi:asparagine synthase (glutamine-hydrolysing)
MARQVRRQKLTYLSPKKLRSLLDVLETIERDRVEGGFLEAGVALGGSAILMADAARRSGRSFDGYDVFGQIPPPSSRDPEEVHQRYAVISEGRSKGIGDEVYYGYRSELYEEVVQNFDRFGIYLGADVQLHKGLFEETLKPSKPISLAHIDCDWHDPVLLCLERIYPHLSSGAFLVIDDYFDYGGCATAVDAFREGVDLPIFSRRGHLVLRKPQ